MIVRGRDPYSMRDVATDGPVEDIGPDEKSKGSCIQRGHLPKEAGE
jgi:hypothetical protein